MNEWDIIIIGAGSVGVPLAMEAADAGFRVLVLDRAPSCGQGENKHAIGGIRATHSDPGKIITGKRSLEIFSTWERRWGDNIEWQRGGYTFPVYREEEKRALLSILPIQKRFGLEIDFLSADKIKDIVPAISGKDLLGGTYSPGDGSASPLLAVNAFYRRAVESGAVLRFREEVRGIDVREGTAVGVKTDRGHYVGTTIIDAAGGFSGPLSRSAGTDVPVSPESHEAGITEPVSRLFKSMVVDLRPRPGSKNFYFYQNRHGQVVFCLTPEPPILGTDRRETSHFMPLVARRLLEVIPALRHVRVRRQWRGLYPMSPDGSPIVGWDTKVQHLYHATGMCGQGFMLGPGVAQLIVRHLSGKVREEDRVVLDTFAPGRKFQGEEMLK